LSASLETAAAASATTREHDAFTKATFTRYSSQRATKTHKSTTGVIYYIYTPCSHTLTDNME